MSLESRAPPAPSQPCPDLLLHHVFLHAVLPHRGPRAMEQVICGLRPLKTRVKMNFPFSDGSQRVTGKGSWLTQECQLSHLALGTRPSLRSCLLPTPHRFTNLGGQGLGIHVGQGSGAPACTVILALTAKWATVGAGIPTQIREQAHCWTDGDENSSSWLVAGLALVHLHKM